MKLSHFYLKTEELIYRMLFELQKYEHEYLPISGVASNEIQLTHEGYKAVKKELLENNFVSCHPGNNDLVKISHKGTMFMLDTKYERLRMGERDKIELIMKWLFARRQKRNHTLLKDIMLELGIYQGIEEEEERIYSRLKREGFVNMTRAASGTHININDLGVDYCEETSFAKQNKSSITMQQHFHGPISGSQFMNAAGNINNSFQNMGANDDVTDLIQRIREVLRQEADEQQRADLEEGLLDVEAKVLNKEKVPRIQMGALIQHSANLATTGTLMLQLAQLLGLAPKQ